MLSYNFETEMLQFSPLKTNVESVFQQFGEEPIDYLLRLKLNKISAYRSQDISYDAFQPFKNREANDWVTLNVQLSKKLDTSLNGDDTDLDSEFPGGIFIIDDIPIKRFKAKKAEAAFYNYDHNEKRHYIGYCGNSLM